MFENMKEDNKQLKELFKKFNETKSEKDYEAALEELQGAAILIGIKPKTKEDEEKIKGLMLDENYDGDTNIEADYLILEGDNFSVVPVFTSYDEVIENVRNEYSFFQLPFLTAIDLAVEIEQMGILIDPESDDFYLDSANFGVFFEEYDEDVLS